MDKERESQIIKDRLYYFLKEKNLTINRLAQLSNLTQSTLNNIINRGTLPSIGTLRMICEGLEIPVIEFLNIYPYNQLESERNSKNNQIELELQIKKMSQEIEELKKIMKDRA